MMLAKKETTKNEATVLETIGRAFVHKDEQGLDVVINDGQNAQGKIVIMKGKELEIVFTQTLNIYRRKGGELEYLGKAVPHKMREGINLLIGNHTVSAGERLFLRPPRPKAEVKAEAALAT